MSEIKFFFLPCGTCPLLSSSAQSLRLTLSHPSYPREKYWISDFISDVNFGCNHFLKRPGEKEVWLCQNRQKDTLRKISVVLEYEIINLEK